MKFVITIEDNPKNGHVSVTVQGEEKPRDCSTSHMFELILEAVKFKFQPVTTFFKPRKKEGRS